MMSGGVVAFTAPRNLPINPCACPLRSSISAGRRIATTSKQFHKPLCRGRIELHSTMIWGWQDFRAVSKALFRKIFGSFESSFRRIGGPFVVCDIAGQYEDTFDDVDEHLLDYFTYKAVRTILTQLHETNPDQYSWFYDFVVKNKPQDGKLFLRTLVKERQELGERVMVTRLYLFNKWVKKYKHDTVEKAISGQNLDLLRERLIQTVRMPSDGEDFESPLSNT